MCTNAHNTLTVEVWQLEVLWRFLRSCARCVPAVSQAHFGLELALFLQLTKPIVFELAAGSSRISILRYPNTPLNLSYLSIPFLFYSSAGPFWSPIMKRLGSSKFHKISPVPWSLRLWNTICWSTYSLMPWTQLEANFRRIWRKNSVHIWWAGHTCTMCHGDSQYMMYTYYILLYPFTNCSQGLVCIPQSNRLIIHRFQWFSTILERHPFWNEPHHICHSYAINIHRESTGGWRAQSCDPRWMASMRKICSCRSGAANWSWRMWRSGHWGWEETGEMTKLD